MEVVGIMDGCHGGVWLTVKVVMVIMTSDSTLMGDSTGKIILQQGRMSTIWTVIVFLFLHHIISSKCHTHLLHVSLLSVGINKTVLVQHAFSYIKSSRFRHFLYLEQKESILSVYYSHGRKQQYHSKFVNNVNTRNHLCGH